MVQSACDTGVQAPNYCPTTVDEVTSQIVALLPEGPAWEAGRVSGTTMNGFWRGASGIYAYLNQRICDMLKEFYCDSIVESFDQWVKEYALGEDCDPYGHNLCAKVTAQGGASPAFFVQIARNNGWVVEVDDHYDEPIAGDFLVGCTPLGPTPVIASDGSNLSYGELCGCAFGEVVHHPEPQYWEHSLTAGSICWVPGSNLGQGPDVDESCCMIVGWYESPLVPAALTRSDACIDDGRTIRFDCPLDGTPLFVRTPCDSTTNYRDYGQSHVWEVTVDMTASLGLQNVEPDTGPSPQAGNFEAGCTPLCSDDALFVLCFLEKIKPAHTTLVTNVRYG